MKLDCVRKFSLSPKPPFHFDGTFHKPSHFPDKMDDWEPNKYWQSIRIGGRPFGLKIENRGTNLKPNLKIGVFYNGKISDEELKSIKDELNWRFELDKDFREFNDLAKKDKLFYPVFKRWLGMRNASSEDLYGLLIVAIVLQNATVRRTVQMMTALHNKYSTKLKFDGKEICSIWAPEKLKNVSEQELRDLKVGYRAKFIKKLTDDFINGKVDEYAIRKLDSESAKKELIKLYGVGPETARILLFEVFHHYDTFDHVSPWQQKIYSRLFYNKPLVSAKKIKDDIIKRYGKYSMLAVHYIWEDVFWKRKTQHIEWLEKEIRL